MSKSNTFENELLLHIFNNASIANVGDATGLPASSTEGSLYVSFHTADPGEAGNQTTSETAYPSYARVAVARNSGGWTVTGNSVSPTANVDAPESTAGTQGGNLTHFAVGTASSGTGKVLYSGALDTAIVMAAGVIPRLKTGTTITED